jgi:hypothetical protein
MNTPHHSHRCQSQWSDVVCGYVPRMGSDDIMPEAVRLSVCLSRQRARHAGTHSAHRITDTYLAGRGDVHGQSQQRWHHHRQTCSPDGKRSDLCAPRATTMMMMSVPPPATYCLQESKRPDTESCSGFTGMSCSSTAGLLARTKAGHDGAATRAAVAAAAPPMPGSSTAGRPYLSASAPPTGPCRGRGPATDTQRTRTRTRTRTGEAATVPCKDTQQIIRLLLASSSPSPCPARSHTRAACQPQLARPPTRSRRAGAWAPR